MWEINNYDQSETFLIAVLLGAVFSILYLFFYVLGKTALKNKGKFFFDFIFWLIIVIPMFVLLLIKTDGELRGYVFFGEFLGFFISYHTIWIVFYKPIFKFICAVLFCFSKTSDIFGKFFKKIWKIKKKSQKNLEILLCFVV